MFFFFFILQCEQFRVAGAEVGETPSDVVSGASIIFSCVPDPHVAKDVCFFFSFLNVLKLFVFYGYK